MNKKIWYIIIGVAVAAVLGLLIYWAVKKPASNPPPGGKPPAASSTPVYQAPQMTEDEAVLLAGRIVVEALGTYESRDPFFRNLRSVESYVTAELYSRLQAIIDRGIDENVSPFSKTTEVVSRQITDRGVMQVEAEYAVKVTRSDGKEAVSETVKVVFVRIGPRWYVDDSSQLK